MPSGGWHLHRPPWRGLFQQQIPILGHDAGHHVAEFVGREHRVVEVAGFFFGGADAAFNLEQAEAALNQRTVAQGLANAALMAMEGGLALFRGKFADGGEAHRNRQAVDRGQHAIGLSGATGAAQGQGIERRIHQGFVQGRHERTMLSKSPAHPRIGRDFFPHPARNSCRLHDPGQGGGMDARNVLGQPLEACSTRPMTGFYRDGCCHTGPEDRGRHTVCAVMTGDFLAFSRQAGNDLSTPRPEYQFPGLRPGDRWCLCAARWKEAWEAGVAPQVVLASTHEATLRLVPRSVLEEHAWTGEPEVG